MSSDHSTPPSSVPMAGIPVEPTHAVPPPTIIVQRESRSIVWRMLAFFGWAGFSLVALVALAQFVAFRDYFDNTRGITEKYHSGKKLGGTKVAIIAVDGLITDDQTYVKAQIDRVREDNKVKAVVVRVNSPGGTVSGSDFILHHLNKLREDRDLPIVVSMGGLATSGGYYVSMAVGDEDRSIFAEPTTTTGSIGVMMPRYDVSGLLDRFDVKDDSLATHPRKLMGSMTRPMPEEHRKLLEIYLNESFARFKEIIRAGRPQFRENPEQLDQLATGEIFTANQALRNGLVDAIGFVEDAVDRVVELAQLDKDDVRVVRFERPLSLFNLTGLSQSTQGSSGLWQVPADWGLGAPRAYYLVNSWPVFSNAYRQLLAAP